MVQNPIMLTELYLFPFLRRAYAFQGLEAVDISEPKISLSG